MTRNIEMTFERMLLLLEYSQNVAAKGALVLVLFWLNS